MSRSLLEKHISYIYLLGETTSAAQRKALLNTITQEQFRLLTLVLYNIVKLKIPIEYIDKKRVKRYQRPLTAITDKKIGTRQRLSILKQNPTAVGLLLKAALPGLRSVRLP